MAITHKYVDSASGSDANDGDSDANAYEFVQKAVDVIAGSVGNQINLKSNQKHITPSTTGVVWTSYSPTNSFDNPLMIRGYTTTADDGGVAELDGNASSASLFEAGSHPQFTKYIDLKMHNTTADVLDLPIYSAVFRCELYNGGSVATLDLAAGASHVVGSHIHTGTSGAVGLDIGPNSFVFGNFITGHDDHSIITATNVNVTGNLAVSGGARAISSNSDRTVIVNNTLIGDSTANNEGIDIGGAREAMVVLSNIIKGWNGTNAVGIKYTSGGNSLMSGYNNFHDNTTDTSGVNILGLDLTAFDTTTDPTFTDAGNDDYRVGTNAKADGYPTVFKGASLSTTFVDVGALQRQEAGGGGGGGKQAGSGGGQVG